MSVEAHDLLENYELTGEERYFLEAKPLYERALAEASDPRLLLEYGYLLECHGRHTIRLAVEQYERAIELDPSADKPRYQLIAAKAALRDTDEAITLCEGRLAASPRDPREYRFLASAYLASHRHAEAGRVVDAGLELAGENAFLISCRGEVKAGIGDPEGVLADWRLALDLDPNDIGPLYSSAFLLEREGLLDAAAEAWRSIIDSTESRGLTLEAQWPKRELERLIRKIAGT
jgi:tetratricopeptide (TPR) repeat protein